MSEDHKDFETSPVAETSKKGRSHNEENQNSTLFVSSLPYNATTTDLLTHFSFIGPVRHGFVATDKTSGKSKGVGYVTFSLREDAERAIEELDGGAFGDKGRKLRVSWADRRPAQDERSSRPVKKPKVEPVDTTEAPVDPNATRTLVITGLPADLTKAVLWKRIRKVHEQAEVTFPVDGRPETAYVLMPTLGEALKAVPKLHGHTYKGAVLSCVLKRKLDKAGTTKDGKGASHAGRLIVRNLAWDTTVQDLQRTFLPYGPIHSIDLPTLPSKLPSTSAKPAPPRARGFAFVWFMDRKHAEKAMTGVNGKAIQRAGGSKSKKVTAEEDRKVAVDWALSKDKWEKSQNTPGDVKIEEETEDSDAVSGSSVEGEEPGNDSNASEDNVDVKEEADAEGGEDDLEDVDEEKPVKPLLPAVDVGSTLFIRNLSFEATEPELSDLFRSFGPLRYARITMDKLTGRSRGTGFVCYWKKESADAAIAESERVAQETGANAQPLGGKNPFALPSVLTVDPSSSLANRLVLHGRTLEVGRAVTREEAGQMKEDGERARNAGDKRNTYLMREGVVFPNSPAAATLPEAEVEKRQASFNARRTLLRSNPSLYISKTRLSIRQLPLFATDRTLKRLAIHAVRAFDEEVKAGTRDGLSRAEELDSTLSPAIAARKDKSKGKGKQRGERETAVIQSKVVRQSEKLDPLSGQGRSKGYGFLEMRSHHDALKVLRWANNNREVGQLFSVWHKEEMADWLEKCKKGLEVARGKKDEQQIEELEGRLKRLDHRLGEKDVKDGGMRGGKTLLIEFSIENVQVVKRRVDKIAAVRSGDFVPKSMREDKKRKAEESGDEAEPRQTKSVKRSKGDKGKDRKGSRKASRPVENDEPAAPVEGEKRGLEKLGKQLGSLIGRKRKMRKGGK
ncbi:hypothetical protein BD324DRAFT_630367 [Kockovaella imperatae]|uniref:RRM domain-containing protein n=1 Tax=Kockovaella imperatae TaxID=4999 RepID=A0A1Y1UF63_9TREE|nr:hypothetical protein BD324DRAFT_630367 [Kockovaella imperatae]ORX36146.1 hypothetical protein BD324DRAFT_630367 [Kockovaella imperatae]